MCAAPTKKAEAERIAAGARAIANKRAAQRSAAPSLANVNIVAPPDEQRRFFSEKPVAVRTEKGQVVGRAYKRQPYFVTLAKLPADKAQPKGHRLISAEQFRAMRFYRSAWESAQASEMRCALDVSVRGGSGDRALIPSEMWESACVRDCERPFRADLLDTMRAVILFDMSFAAVAMQRWGSRERQRIIVGSGKAKPRTVTEIVPKSSQHPITIRDDFLLGLPHLVKAAGRWAFAE